MAPKANVVVQHPSSRGAFRRMGDSLMNFVNGLGTPKDATTHGRYSVPTLTTDQLENAYRGDWIARKTVNLPADDATREWREWQAPQNQIGLIEDVETVFNIQNKLRSGMIKARLYGGGALVMGINQGQSWDPINLDALGKECLQFVHVLSKEELQTGKLIDDIQSPYYNEPEYYETTGTTRVKIHPSRVVRLIGAELPDPRNSTQGIGWGDSILTVVDDAIKDAGLVSGGIASLVNDSKIDVIRIPELAENLSTQEYADKLTKRFTYANTAKSMINALLLDKEEEWERITTDFGTLPDILKLYLLIASAAADIPVTRMMGQSPAGMNATGESDTRNYYDRISSEQRTVLTPTMARLDEVMIRSALGTRPPDIWYQWVALWQMSEKEQADVAKSKAETFKVDVDAAVIPVKALKKARINQLIEDGTYPGLEQAIDEVVKEETASNDPAKLGEVVSGTGGDNVQGAAFNGAQITAVAGIVTQVVEEQMPPETAIQLILLGFPSVTETQAKAMIDPIAAFEAKEKPAPVIAPPVPGGSGAVPPKAPLRVVGGTAAAKEDVKDALPQTLYVRRDVVNGKEILDWASSQGFETTLAADDLHVTIMYSKTPVDWMKVGMDSWGENDKGQVTIPPGGPRIVEPLGTDGAVVLEFASSQLQWRHEDLKRSGAESDYDSYLPHVTITYNLPDGFDLTKVEPYRGKIILGPEIFEVIRPNAQNEIEEVEA